MRFTLTYEGPLRPSGSPDEKQAIRREFHPQLAELWNSEPLSALRNATEPGGACRKELDGHAFSAIVHNHFKLRAELEIMLLRPEPAGAILANADIDNRLKTLFDALRWPIQRQELGRNASHAAAVDPLHCLLEDDRLITRVSVDTDRWLGVPHTDHVRLFMRVRVWSPTPTYASLSLGG